MNITEHRLELQPEAEQASDFIVALVAHYESQIDELKQQTAIAFRGGSVSHRAASKIQSSQLLGRALQRDLAYGQNVREWRGYDECMVSRARYLESQDLIGRSCYSSRFRLVRTRMLSCVGKMRAGGHLYPISFVASRTGPMHRTRSIRFGSVGQDPHQKIRQSAN
jgi:hypothetical protein